jgi:hypothetical protein
MKTKTTKKSSPKSKLLESTFRVYRITAQLNESVKLSKNAKEMNAADYIEQAVKMNLPGIEKAIKKELSLPTGVKHPVRWPLKEGVLEELQRASKETGVAQSQLLMLSLHRASAASPSEGRKAVKLPQPKPKTAKSRKSRK